MSNHTPGPWTAVFYNIDRTVWGIFSNIHEHDEKEVLRPDDKLGEANAHLIAAAPEMYEILKSILGDMDAYENPYRRVYEYEIEALITKTEGSAGMKETKLIKCYRCGDPMCWTCCTCYPTPQPEQGDKK